MRDRGGQHGRKRTKEQDEMERMAKVFFFFYCQKEFEF
jgi:hypothetical protein